MKETGDCRAVGGGHPILTAVALLTVGAATEAVAKKKRREESIDKTATGPGGKGWATVSR